VADRRLSMRARRRVIFAQLFVTLLVSASVMGYQRPPLLGILLHISLPWICLALVAVFPSFFTLYLDASDGRVPLSAIWMVHSIALVMLFRCAKYYEWTRLVGYSCLAGIGLILLVIGIEKQYPRKDGMPGLFLLVLFAVAYGYGLISELDIVFDHSPETTIQSTVVGRSKQKAYSLRIEPWGPVRNVRNVTVTRAVFDAVGAGGSVCIVLRHGALGLGWYSAQACPWLGGQVSLASEDVLPPLRIAR
jgi:hypothetical protein